MTILSITRDRHELEISLDSQTCKEVIFSTRESNMAHRVDANERANNIRQMKRSKMYIQLIDFVRI